MLHSVLLTFLLIVWLVVIWLPSVTKLATAHGWLAVTDFLPEVINTLVSVDVAFRFPTE